MYIVFLPINTSSLLLVQTSQIPSHFLLQILKVGSKERRAVVYNILSKLVPSADRIVIGAFGQIW